VLTNRIMLGHRFGNASPEYVRAESMSALTPDGHRQVTRDLERHRQPLRPGPNLVPQARLAASAVVSQPYAGITVGTGGQPLMTASSCQ
jgi:hypothetical protein